MIRKVIVLNDTKTKLALGFATGRKRFLKVLRSGILNAADSHPNGNEEVGLNLFVAYDLSYQDTNPSYFTTIRPDIATYLSSSCFLGAREKAATRNELIGAGILSPEDVNLLFDKGYASQRNIIMYRAIKAGMDYLFFMDDDEYSMAVMRTGRQVVWAGQQVVDTHLQHIAEADVTVGHRCGYNSPIPYVDYDEHLSEDAFHSFISALENDIVSWEATQKVMSDGGVTYADPKIIHSGEVCEKQEVDHCKFIVGSNLCINLTDPARIFPFYNPPGARGEDTFLSTCLSQRKVLQVPCYTFHDGFGAYDHLLSGVLPTHLMHIRPDSPQIVERFYKACIGWVRYKPLLLFITDKTNYRQDIEEMTASLESSLPAVCRYFETDAFKEMLPELHRYDMAVEENFEQFEHAKLAWSRVMDYLMNRHS